MPRFGKPPDMIVHQDEPLNAEPPRGALAGAPVTPVERFYVRNHGPVPAGAGPLRIEGLVTQPARADARRPAGAAAARAHRDAAMRGQPPRGSPDGARHPRRGAVGPGRDRHRALGRCRAGGRARRCRRRSRRPPRRAHRRRPRRGGRPAAALRGLDPAREGAATRGPAGVGDERRAAGAGPRRAAAGGRAGLHRRAQRQVAGADRAASPSRRRATTRPPPTGCSTCRSARWRSTATSSARRSRAAQVALDGYAFAGGERHVARVEVSADGGADWTRAELLGETRARGRGGCGARRSTLAARPPRGRSCARGTAQAQPSPRARRPCGTRRATPTARGGGSRWR